MKPTDDELLPEYEFDYRQAKPNRFANKGESLPQRTVILDEDVAAVFTTPESVNKVLLRALISPMPSATDNAVS